MNNINIPPISEELFEKFLEDTETERFFDLQMHILREAYKKGLEDGFKRVLQEQTK